MPFAPLTPAQRRRLLWRRFVERKTLIRHPVSTTRHRIGIILLAAMLAAFAWYGLITRDAAIRRRAVEFLAAATSGEVRVGRAHFEMFGGITLEGVHVSVPFDKRLDPTAVRPESREIFSAQTVRLIHNPWRLLLGDFRVEHIIATKPTIILAQNVDTGLRNWQLLSTDTGRRRGGPKGKSRPAITLRMAKAVVISIDETGERRRGMEELDADVRPHPQQDTAYCIEVRRFGEPAERTTAVFDPGQRLVTNTPFVDARTVRLQLPRSTQRFFDRIGLQGEVKLSRLIYDAKTPQERNTTIELRSVRCGVPLSFLRGADLVRPDAAASAASEHEPAVIMMTAVEGVLNLRGTKLELDVSGAINGAKCRVTGRLDSVGGALEEMGLNLRIDGQRVPAPEGALREQLLADAAAPRILRGILQDYEPHGEFDIDFHFSREAGPAADLKFSGLLKPKEAAGRCRYFPYLVDDLQGQVRFESNRVYLEGLSGRHGPALVNINGDVDLSTWWAGVEVDIAASSVPLDEQLYEPLSDRYRSLWRHFSPQGLADVSIRLRRPGVNQGEPDPSWQTFVTAELQGARTVFAEYPYPLEDVHGRLEISPEQIHFINLAGRNGDGAVRVDGSTTFDAAGVATVELRIAADHLRLDDTLASALPPDGRGAFAQFQPNGFVDLSGTVSLHDPARGLLYDMQAKVHDASLAYQSFPYRLEDVSGEISIKPEAITLLTATGRHGATEVAAQGEVRRVDGGYVADLTFDCRQVALDQELYDSLPAPLKEAWRLLGAAGTLNVRTLLHHVSQNGETWQRHRTEVEPGGAKVCLQGFPLPLTLSSGRVIVTDDQVEFLSVGGQASSGTFELSGTMDFAPPGVRGALTVSADGMAFGDDLISALPSRLRRALESMKPSGKFGLRLDPLRFQIDGDGQAEWDFAGQLVLSDVQTDLEFDLRQASGVIKGSGRVDVTGAAQVDAQTDLANVILAGWPLEAVEARITAEPGSPAVQVENAVARLYGGETTGLAAIKFGDHRVEYQVAVTARDLQLNQYLAATRPKPAVAAKSDQAAKGSIHGNLAIRGRTGVDGYREGAGEIFLREAQVWKLPVIFAVFQVLNLTPDENVFHDGWLKYYISGETLTFNEIDLQGKAMSFLGGGTMNLKNKELDVMLLAGSPVRLRVPLLTELLQGASREVAQVHVTGTLQHPQITPQPLNGLAATLKMLFPEPPPRKN